MFSVVRRQENGPEKESAGVHGAPSRATIAAEFKVRSAASIRASGCGVSAVDGALPGPHCFARCSVSGIGSLGFCLDAGGDDIRRDFPRVS